MSQTPAESTTTVTKTAPPSKIKGALLRYRVMAWVTGLWLLLLVAELILAYGFDNDSLGFVPIVHGWVYFVYLIMAIDLGIKVRWPIGKAILTLIAGTIPFLSFWVEHKRTQEIRKFLTSGDRSGIEEKTLAESIVLIVIARIRR